MIGKRDKWIFALALLFAALLFGVRALLTPGGAGGRSVNIYVNGELYETAALGSPRDIVIDQKNGARNVIAITENGFFMRSSTCANQSCVHQGEVTPDNFASRPLGAHVICLPNRVDAELALSKEDDVSLAPDA